MLFNPRKYGEQETSRNDELAASLLRACPTLREAGWTVVYGLRGYQSVWLVPGHEIEADASVGGIVKGRRGEAPGGNKPWRIGGPVGEVELF